MKSCRAYWEIWYTAGNLRWFGHVVRAKATRPSTILHGKDEGKRSRGRPERHWLDDVKVYNRAELEWDVEGARRLRGLGESAWVKLPPTEWIIYKPGKQCEICLRAVVSDWVSDRSSIVDKLSAWWPCHYPDPSAWLSPARCALGTDARLTWIMFIQTRYKSTNRKWNVNSGKNIWNIHIVDKVLIAFNKSVTWTN